MIVWMAELRKSISRLLQARGKYSRHEWVDERPMWASIDEKDWDTIRHMFRVVWQHSIWIEKHNTDTIRAISSTKQKEWKEMLLDGRLPGRLEPLFPRLDSSTIFDNALR
jgi:hypothetical protein